MNELNISGSESMPLVIFNPESGMLKMEGVAIPENIKEFAEPILEWLSSYCSSPNTVTELNLFFEYLNTAATKFIFHVCEILNNSHRKNNCRVKLVWKYHRGDLEMLELGQEIFEDFICLTEILAIDEGMNS